MIKKPKFTKILLAGLNSGSGKTTAAMALARLLIGYGWKVAPFKCGPDYLDTMMLAQAAERPAINLDSMFLSDDQLKETFDRHCAGCDIALVEGVMGMFDGVSLDRFASSSDIARRLELPVVLVVNCKGMSQTIAPLVKGIVDWAPELNVIGVIGNNVNSRRHGTMISEALAAAGLPPLLASLPNDPKLKMAERHLGIAPNKLSIKQLDRMGEALELDYGVLVDALPEFAPPTPKSEALPPAEVRLGVAMDDAFNFYYEDNLHMLKRLGVEIVPFSPLHDANLPQDLGGIYLGGGFPEIYAEQLAANSSMLNSIRAFAATGRPIYGECGGYLYLAESLIDQVGNEHKFLGLLPGSARMGEKVAAIGYRNAVTRFPGFFGAAGTAFKGHEFHYSLLEQPSGVEPAFAAETILSKVAFSGQQRGNILASFYHLHFGSNPKALANFVCALKEA